MTENGLKNDIDIKWTCEDSRLILVSPNLPPKMQREADEWRIESFELKQALYKGAASLVYLAFDTVSLSDVVLKLYRKAKLTELSRFQAEREISIHSSIQHENIIDFYGAFEDDKYVYFVQEYAEKGDLFCVLKQMGGYMKEREAVQDVLFPFLSALQYLHSKGILHRDIKPENIFVKADNTIKVADFGLSIDERKERPVTRAGTLDYMPPEVLGCPDKTHPQDNKNNKSLTYGAKADVWGVGVLAYELTTGAPPFENESRTATYEEIMFKDPKFPDAMSESCKEFISKALEKSSSARPAVQGLIATSWIRMNKKRTSVDLPAMSSGGPIDQDWPLPSKESDDESVEEELEEPSEPSQKDSPSVECTKKDSAPVEDTVQETTLKEVKNNPNKTLLPSKSTLKSSTSSSELESKVSKGTVKFDAQSMKKQSFDRSHRSFKVMPHSKSEDYLGQLGNIPRLEAALSLNESKLKQRGSLNLVHKFFSKSEEETNADTMLAALNRLPSYSFFPKNNERNLRPAHRLSRELTGTAVSFTKKRTSTKELENAKTPPETQPQQSPTANAKDSKKGKMLSFFKLRKKK